MSQAIWNELQELKARVAAIESAPKAPDPDPNILTDVLERLDRLEKRLNGGKGRG